MRDLLVVAGALVAVLLLAVLVPLAYMLLIACCQGSYLTFRAFLARRRLQRSGGPEGLSDQQLAEVKRRIDARMALKPLYRNPRWLSVYFLLQQQLDHHQLNREAWALLKARPDGER